MTNRFAKAAQASSKPTPDAKALEAFISGADSRTAVPQAETRKVGVKAETKNLSLRLEPDLYEALRKHKYETGVSAQGLIVRLLRDHLHLP